MSGGAPRSHSISPAAAPPGAATAPNPWPWPAKPGLSDTTAGGGRPRAAHHRCPSPPPSPVARPPRGPSPYSTGSHLPQTCTTRPSPPPPTDPVLPPPSSLSAHCPAPRASSYIPISLHVGPEAGWCRTRNPSLSTTGPGCPALRQSHPPASSMPTPSRRF